MFARLKIAALLISAAAAMQVSAADALFDLRVLLQQVRTLITTHSQLFNADEINRLRAAGEQQDVSSIEEVLFAKAQIEVSVNPEGRVKARRLAASLPLPRCGSTSVWLIRVANSGFVTAPLAVSVLDGALRATPRVSEVTRFDLAPRKLTGAPVEYQVMRVNIAPVGRVDATLLFTVGPATEDLGARAEVPVLVNCLNGG